MHSRRYYQPRQALLGDAAHHCHPVAGQGLNLGIRDGAMLAQKISGLGRIEYWHCSIFASIRKDGLLLFAEPDTLALLTPLQILTGVYLAGVLLPCLVTALTIAREQSVLFAVRLMARGAIAAIVFSMLLAWGSTVFVAFEILIKPAWG